MLSIQSALACLVIILIAISSVYCGDGSVSASRQATPVSPISNNNPWSKLENQNVNVNPSWGAPNHQTTPWPALGARYPVNLQSNANVNTPTWVKPAQGSAIQSNAQSTNNNRNIGVELSYGLNPSQNSNPIQANRNRDSVSTTNNRNVGVDLSYGINSGGTINTQSSLSTNQNLPSGSPVSSQHKLNKAQTPVAGLPQNVGPIVQPPKSPGPNQKPTVQNPATGSQGSAVNIDQKKNSIPGPNQKTDPSQQTQTNLSEDDELREFSETLLRKDVNNAAKYVTVNYQGKTTSRSAVDEAPQPLLSIKPEVFSIPTIAKMLLLHNNYILETNKNEYVTPLEKTEENNFLDAMLSTPVMQYARNFLIEKGKISKDPKDFRDKLKEIWFNMYSRGGGKIGSSGFEHVFLVELKGNDVSGLHNWLYFNEAESKKLANYLGYMKKLDFGNKGAIVKYHFQLDGKDKPVGSMFIGTSPELEIALYSTCFILRADRICPLRLGGHNFIIRTYTYRYRGKNMIGSAFPEI